MRLISAVSGVRFPAPPPIFYDRDQKLAAPAKIYCYLFLLSKDITFVAIGPYSQLYAKAIIPDICLIPFQANE
jgi:hypothetical protein